MHVLEIYTRVRFPFRDSRIPKRWPPWKRTVVMLTSFTARSRHVLEKREKNVIIRMLPRVSWCFYTRTRYSEKVVDNSKRECGIHRIPLAVFDENDEQKRGERREGERARNVPSKSLKGFLCDRERSGRIACRRAEVRRKERRKLGKRVENTTGWYGSEWYVESRVVYGVVSKTNACGLYANKSFSCQRYPNQLVFSISLGLHFTCDSKLCVNEGRPY